MPAGSATAASRAKSALPSAPACAIHKTGKADPEDCKSEIPSFWIADTKDAGKDAHDAIHYQGEYVKELIAETDYPSFDVDGACEAFFEWKEHKKADIMAFRNHAYKSVITGTMAPVHHTPWKDALEDSMESYLKN